MARRRRASLWSRTGRRIDRGRTLPGYYVRYSDYAPDGRRICRSINFLSHRAALAWVRRYNARADLQRIGEVVPVALPEALREFLVGCGFLRPETTADYARSLGMLGAVVGRDTIVCRITPADIDRFAAARLRRSGQATVAKRLRYMRSFWEWCIRRGYAVENVIDSATTHPRGPFVRQRPSITEEQLSALVASLDTDDRRLAVWIAITTGMDRGRIKTLTANEVLIGSESFHFTRPKTGRVFTIPIHPAILPLLVERIARTPPGRPLLSGLARVGHGRDWWERATIAAGVPGLWFRDLRAVATSRLCRLSGGTLADAQRLLGHASIGTTAAHYQMPDPQLARLVQSLPLPGLPTPAQST